MSFHPPKYPPNPDTHQNGVSTMLSAVLLWLRIVSGILLGRGDSLYDEAPNHPVFPANRDVRQRRARFKNRPVPPARNHAVLRKLYGRGLSLPQFLERLCRLSVDGRIRVYYMVYWSSRMTREAFMAIFSRGDFRVPDGLWDVHLGPD